MSAFVAITAGQVDHDLLARHLPDHGGIAGALLLGVGSLVLADRCGTPTRPEPACIQAAIR